MTIIELKSQWIAWIRDYRITNPSNNAIVYDVINPATDNDYGFLAYGANFQANAVTGFDGLYLRNLIDSASSINSIKLKFSVDVDNFSDRHIELAHYFRIGIPAISEIFNEMFIEHFRSVMIPSNESEVEIDITSELSNLLLSYGFYFMYGSGSVEVYRPSIFIDGVWEPQRPTSVSPVGGIREDRTKTIRFQWNHQGIFPQAKYDLRYRVKGTSTWTTVTNTSSDNYYDMLPNTLTANEYEWQVRTYFNDSINTNPSAWSIVQIFIATEATNAPVIISPTIGQIMPTQDLYIEWDEVIDQIQFEVELVKGSQVVQQTLRTSSNNSVTLSSWLENEENYIVRLRVLVEGKFWSDWAEVNISVSYTQPAKPTLTITPNENEAYLEIDIYNPPPIGTEPAPVSQELFRSETSGEWIKIANLVANSRFIDYAVASGKTYQYRVTVLADNDVTNTSDVFTGLVEFTSVYLSLANEQSHYIRLRKTKDRTSGMNFNAHQKTFVGRERPVTEFGETMSNNLSIECIVEQNQYEQLIELIKRQETLLYRDERGRKLYVTIPNLSVADIYLKRYSVVLQINEVYFDEAVT